MKYIDGFVLPIAQDQIDNYREMARQAGEVWIEHGALEFFECIGDDLDRDELVPFPKMAGCRDGETVVFSWIVYESREHRDEVNRKVMEDPRIKAMGPEKMPFDCSRMAHGGFSTLVELP
ncbi:MAG: DUF1428 domain-containing protein [Wenzhouxiangellaceae bacterium]